MMMTSAVSSPNPEIAGMSDNVFDAKAAAEVSVVNSVEYAALFLPVSRSGGPRGNEGASPAKERNKKWFALSKLAVSQAQKEARTL
jgi:hypothetical protein